MEDARLGGFSVRGDVPGVFLITGLSGSGKTTVGRVLARSFERAAHIDGDWVQHHLTISGLVGPWEQSAEADPQVDLRLRNCAALADNFFGAGFVPIVEHGMVTRSRVQRQLQLLRSRPVFLIVLAPRLDIVLSRDRDREGKTVHSGDGNAPRHEEEVMRRELDGLGLWVDSGPMTPGETVAAILAGFDHGRMA